MPSRRRQVTYSQRPNHAARSAHARGDRMFRTYDTSMIRPKKSKAAPIAAAVIVLAVIVALVVFVVLPLFRGPAVDLLPEGEPYTLEVPAGAGAQAIGEDLQEAGLFAKTSDFTNRVKELGKEQALKPGTYALVGGMTVDDIISMLEAGPAVDGLALTIPEGYKLQSIANRVAEVTQGTVSAAAFVAAASDASAYAADYPFLADAGTNSLEGFLFPKTYSLKEGATADDIIRMMLDQFQKETASLDLSYPQSQGMSLYDIVNLASIVEKESTGDEAVRAQVAAVFYNRLHEESNDETYGFLQSDATTAYVVGEDPTAEQVHDETDPYSTYAHKGLPPTPICSPGLACLQAVCAPANDFEGMYYFIFWNNDKGEVEYAFSRTYDEHQAAIAAHL